MNSSRRGGSITTKDTINRQLTNSSTTVKKWLEEAPVDQHRCGSCDFDPLNKPLSGSSEMLINSRRQPSEDDQGSTNVAMFDHSLFQGKPQQISKNVRVRKFPNGLNRSLMQEYKSSIATAEQPRIETKSSFLRNQIRTRNQTMQNVQTQQPECGAVSNELACSVVKSYLLPMFEAGLKNNIKLKYKKMAK